MRLFDLIMKNFDDDSLGLLGAVLGEHEVKVRDGVEAATAEILCAIGDQTKSQEGRGMLWRELRDADESVASSFPSQLHYQNSRTLVENGRDQLAGLVGDEIKAITNRVSHAADIGSSSAGKMVGAVSPLIFSSLAAWQKKEKVDAEQWQKLFAEQSNRLRERAATASSRRFDKKSGQRTFPSFDNQTTTGQGGAQDKWTAGSGFTPGYTGSAKQKFNATGSNTASSGANTTQSGKVAAGVAGAAAVAAVATAGGKATGTASAAAAQSGSTAAKPATISNSLTADSTSGEHSLWVPDKENLRRERERTAVERARVQREQNLAKKERGGLGWLWWQMLLLAGLAGLGWMFRGQISEAFTGPTTLANAGCNAGCDLEGEPVPMLPSEEAASDSFEGLDAPGVNSIEESSELQETDSAPQLSGNEDMDLQVEEALTALEDGVKEIKDETSAKSALPKMEKGVTTLEELLKTASTWSDVDKELIDIQLEEAAEVFGKLNKSVSDMPNVKGVVSPLFERLEKLLVPQQVAP